MEDDDRGDHVYVRQRSKGSLVELSDQEFTVTGSEGPTAAMNDLNSQAGLKVREAAQLARCGRRAIYSMIHDGRIPAVRVGVAYRIPTRPFLAHLERGDATLIEDDQR